MKTMIVSLFLTLLPGAVLADCASMWVTRNMVFDRAGYCFGSNLGKALFDNGGCIGKDVRLSSADQDFVDYTKEMETMFECNIDTSRRTLNLPLLNQWLQLIDLPRRDYGGSGCLGYLGQPVTLRSGIGGGRVLGQVNPGDDIIFNHWDQAGRSFVTVMRNNREVSLGWADLRMDQLPCRQFAG